MNFMNRAWLYIVRKRGKSILLFVILLVMATFVLTALAPVSYTHLDVYKRQGPYKAVKHPGGADR